jgi:integrase
MPKKAAELGSLQVARLQHVGLHPVGGVAGLRLQVAPTGARSWVMRVMVGGKRSEIGLGGFPDLPLAGAREAARAVRSKISAGINPIVESRAARSSLQAATASAWTFRQCAEALIEAKIPEWKNAKHAAQWTATLRTYAYPVLGNMLAREVELPHVLAVLEPIWKTTTETATRLRARIEAVLDWATTRGYREGLNPARWKGHLKNLLPAPSKIAKVEHHPAIPIGEVGHFMAALRAQSGDGAKALEFAILTAVRSGEVRGATWSEIDIASAVWTIPAARMKMDKEHRVPLSAPALALIKQLPKIAGNDLLFPAPRGGQLSDMTLTAVLRRMQIKAVPHGFRSTFRDWCSERTGYSPEVAEMALAHAIEDKVEGAYRRGELFEKRRRMMRDWAVFCSKGGRKPS